MWWMTAITFRSVYDAEDVYYVLVAAFNASMNPASAGYFDVTAKDELIVLITCSYQHEDGRFMLYCRRLREGETPQAMLMQLAR